MKKQHDPQGVSYCINCKHSLCIFNSLSNKEKEMLREKIVIVNLGKGDKLMRKNIPLSHIIYIREGSVKVFFESEDNPPVIWKIATQDTLLGITSIFEDIVHAYSAMTITESTICFIDVKIVNRLIEQSGLFAKKIVRFLCHEANYAFQKAMDLNRKQMHGRVATILLYLSDTVFKTHCFDPMLTRSEMATLGGISRERLIRALTDLKNEMVININQNNIEILDRDKLINISRSG